jgi:hypothetical protein
MAMGWRNLSWIILAIGLILLLLSDADPMQLMCAGAFISPYLMPQHLLLILPAIGRLRGRRRLLVWLLSLLVALPPMFLSWSLYVAYLFPLGTWLLLRISHRHSRIKDRADFDPVIPLDEVIQTMDAVGKMLPSALRCTAQGGLSITAASKEIERRLAQTD